MDEARIDVAAELVGAEPVLGAGRQQAARRGHRASGIVRREQRREAREQQQQHDDREPDHAERIARKRASRR